MLISPRESSNYDALVLIMKTAKLKRLTEKISYLPFGEHDRPTLAVIAGSQHTLLVDAGNSPAHARLFLSELAHCDIPPIKYVALTHWHWDHSFGLTAMSTTSIAHKNTVEKLIELAQLDWDDEAVNKRVKEGTENTFVQDMIKEEYPAPDRKIQVEIPELTLTEKIVIDLGKIHCLIEHVGGDHSPDSTIIVIPEEKVAFIGDSLYPNPYGKIAGKGEYSCQKLLPLVSRLLSYDVELYVDSHDQPALKKEFQKRCQLLQDIGSLVEAYGTQTDEILRALKKKTKIQGVTIDNSWLEDTEWIIQAFQAGLD